MGGAWCGEQRRPDWKHSEKTKHAFLIIRREIRQVGRRQRQNSEKKKGKNSVWASVKKKKECFEKVASEDIGRPEHCARHSAQERWFSEKNHCARQWKGTRHTADAGLGLWGVGQLLAIRTPWVALGVVSCSDPFLADPVNASQNLCRRNYFYRSFFKLNICSITLLGLLYGTSTTYNELNTKPGHSQGTAPRGGGTTGDTAGVAVGGADEVTTHAAATYPRSGQPTGHTSQAVGGSRRTFSNRSYNTFSSVVRMG